MSRCNQGATGVSAEHLWQVMQTEHDDLVREKIETDLCEQLHAELSGKLRGQAADVDGALYEALHSLLRNPRLFDPARGTLSAYMLVSARRILRRRGDEIDMVCLDDVDLVARPSTDDEPVENDFPEFDALAAAREHALRALTRNEREIYELARAGFTPREIRAQLRRHGRRRRPTVESVRSMRCRARRKVESALRAMVESHKPL